MTVTLREEYEKGVWVIRVNGQIVDTLTDAEEAAGLANRLAGALGVEVNAP